MGCLEPVSVNHAGNFRSLKNDLRNPNSVKIVLHIPKDGVDYTTRPRIGQGVVCIIQSLTGEFIVNDEQLFRFEKPFSHQLESTRE